MCDRQLLFSMEKWSGLEASGDNIANRALDGQKANGSRTYDCDVQRDIVLISVKIRKAEWAAVRLKMKRDVSCHIPSNSMNGSDSEEHQA